MIDDTEALVAVFADLHANSLVGLCPPVVPRLRGTEHKASKAQPECDVGKLLQKHILSQTIIDFEVAD